MKFDEWAKIEGAFLIHSDGTVFDSPLTRACRAAFEAGKQDERERCLRIVKANYMAVPYLRGHDILDDIRKEDK